MTAAPHIAPGAAHCPRAAFGIVPRAAFAHPYVMMWVMFTGAFRYSFVSGNPGLITREVIVTNALLPHGARVPRGPRHRPPCYVWELPRRKRIARRKALTRRAGVSAPQRVVPTGAATMGWRAARHR